MKVYVEVTDTVSIGYTTGIQRVVREVVTRLSGDDFSDIEIVPVFRPSRNTGFRRLTAGEARALAHHPDGGTAGRRADKLGPLSPLVKLAGDTKLVYRARIAYRELRSTITERRAHREDLQISAMEPGSVFLDIEGSWFSPIPRPVLLPQLRANGVLTVVLVHDVMPVLFSEWFDPTQVSVFSDWLNAHIENSDHFLTNSSRTSQDLQRLADDRGREISNRLDRVHLGADFIDSPAERVPLPSQIARYLLVVGTVEPRKNHELVIDAWEELRVDNPDLGLILVGKEGWMVDSITTRIKTHTEFGRTLLWLGGISDSELIWLYQNAFLTVIPSYYEGLGVPVIEALLNGCPVISSTGGALEETGDGYAEFIDPTDVNGLISAISFHLNDPEHHGRAVRLAKEFRAPQWSTTAEEVAAALRRVGNEFDAGGLQ